MEPFIIQCPTCGSSIRIKNAALIGQIANCPKCQSLLQIAPPGAEDGGSPNSNAVADSSALTRESISTNVAENPPQHDDDYRLAPEEPVDTKGPTATPTSAEESDAFEQSVSNWQPADAPLVPTEDWTSASTSKTKQYLLVGILGFTGLLLAVGGFLAFLSWYNKPTQRPAVAQDTGLGTADPSVAAPNSPVNGASDSSGGNESIGVNSGDTKTSEEAANAPGEEAGPATPRDVVGDSQGDDDPQLSDPQLGDEAALPGDVDVAADTTSDPANSSDSNDDGSQVANLGAGNAAFEELSSILGVNINLTIPDESVSPSEPPVTAEELGLRASVSRPPLQPANLDSQLETKLGGVVLTGDPVRLSHWVNTWVHLSGLPTVIDFDLFAAAGIPTRQDVPLPRIQNDTVGGYLKQFSSALGLEAVPREGRYCLLRPSSADLLEKLPATLSIEGIVDEADTQWMLGVLQRWFPEAEGKLTIESGELKFANRDNDLTTWVQIVRLIRSLRAAKIGTATGDPLATRFVTEADVAALAQQTNVVSGQSRPVGQVLARVGRDVDLDIWIDWASVGEIGLGPSVTEAVVTHGRQASRVLTDYAIMFNLEVAIVDQQTVWLTSTKAYRSQVQSYVLPAAGKSVEQWQSELRALTPQAAAAGEVGRVQVELTPDAEFALIRSCRPRMPVIK